MMQKREFKLFGKYFFFNSQSELNFCIFLCINLISILWNHSDVRVRAGVSLLAAPPKENFRNYLLSSLLHFCCVIKRKFIVYIKKKKKEKKERKRLEAVTQSHNSVSKF